MVFYNSSWVTLSFVVDTILRNEFGIAIGQQTIYRYIWDDRDKGGKIYQHLRRRGKKIRNKSKVATVKVNNKKSIDFRLKRLVLMMTAGHWEVDRAPQALNNAALAA